MDCGDNSCLFAVKRGGMRTNGRCRCLDSLDDTHVRLRRDLHAYANRQQVYIAKLEAVAKAARRLMTDTVERSPEKEILREQLTALDVVSGNNGVDSMQGEWGD